MQGKHSLRNWLKEDRDAVLEAIATMTDREAEALLYDWTLWARDNQLPPEDIETGIRNIWMILAGRGWGKTRTGAEYVKELVERGYQRIALVGPTPADARDVMVEGESGLLAIYPEHLRPVYEPSKRRVTFSNGAIATIYSGYKPDQLRGPQHDAFWADELAAWQYMEETWDNLMMGLRLGDPRGVITTTPRPLKLIKTLLKADNVHFTTGTTYENAENLPKSFFDAILDKYKGTRLGRQELEAHILDDNPNALWKRDMIDNHRVHSAPELRRIVIAIDPNASNSEDSDEIGIIAAGVDSDGLGYVLEDGSLLDSPDGWARRATQLYHKYGADRIVAEINNGGNMVEYVIRTVDDKVSYKGVHAAKGKYTRAEPVAALYEQGKVHHVGQHPRLEDELCEWVPGMASPNRLDALVWALTELMLGAKGKWGW